MISGSMMCLGKVFICEIVFVKSLFQVGKFDGKLILRNDSVDFVMIVVVRFKVVEIMIGEIILGNKC